MSTELALMDQKEYILQKFEDKQLVAGIFVDFTQAFDYIKHSILLNKLDHYGIRGLPLKLIDSYLSNRIRFVSVNRFTSSKEQIIVGVPQGSILGPLLFNLYINDITHICPDLELVIYADDTSIFISSACETDLITRANSVLEKLDTWTSTNHLKINTKKTKAVIFHSKCRRIAIQNDITFRNSKIDIVPCVKVLGVYFSENLQWDDHVTYLVQKLSSVTGMLNHHRFSLPQSVKLMIYNALFVSSLHYCLLVWGTTTATN